MERAISRQQLEHACRVLRKPRKTATPRALATACSLPLEAMRIVLKTLQEQPYITSVRNDKGAWLSYTFTNYHVFRVKPLRSGRGCRAPLDFVMTNCVYYHP